MHLGDPAREREHAIAGYGEDEAGGCDDGDGGVLKAMLAAWRERVNGEDGSYQPQSENADHVHHDMAALAQNNGVERHERLRGPESQQGFGVRLLCGQISTCYGQIDEGKRYTLTAQNKNRIIVANPPTPLATVLQKMPRAAVIEAFFVSSATWPDASNPIKIPAVARYDRHQFQPAGAPVPL